MKPLLRTLHHTAKTLYEFKRHPDASLNDLIAGLTPHDSPTNNVIMSRINAAYLKAKETPYAIWGMWASLINGHSGSLVNFFRHKMSNGIVSHATYDQLVNGWNLTRKRFILTMLGDIKLWKDLTESKYVSDLYSTGVGNPWGYTVKDTLIIPDAPRHHYYAHRVKNLIGSGVVAEIGGGYGGFAYYLLRDNEKFKYINYDIPEVLLISSFYLMHAFPEKRFQLYGEPDGEYDVKLMPHYRIGTIYDNTVDLFINSNSLSEMPEPVMRDYISHICRATRQYFFHVNSDEPNELEVAASKFPITPSFKLIHKYHCGFGGFGNRYREYLYERKPH